MNGAHAQIPLTPDPGSLTLVHRGTAVALTQTAGIDMDARRLARRQSCSAPECSKLRCSRDLVSGLL